MAAKKPIVHLGADHAGLVLKNKLKDWLVGAGYHIVDHGAVVLQPTDDYPDFIAPVAKAVAKDAQSYGVVCGGSGQGEAMVANRRRGVRAAVYYGGPLDIVRLSREHNNSNILSLGARFVSQRQAVIALELWLKTKFTGGRHKRRLVKLDAPAR